MSTSIPRRKSAFTGPDDNSEAHAFTLSNFILQEGFGGAVGCWRLLLLLLLLWVVGYCWIFYCCYILLLVEFSVIEAIAYLVSIANIQTASLLKVVFALRGNMT